MPPAVAPAQSYPAQAYPQQSYQQQSYATPPMQSGGGRGLASYEPPSRPIESTGSVAPRSIAATPAWTREGGTHIIVGTADTLEVIAHRYNVPESAILEANSMHGPRTLTPGQSLVIPRHAAATASVAAPVVSAPAIASAPVTRPATVAAVSSNVHFVNHGDTLMTIAKRNNISPEQLARANHLPAGAKLKVGDKITVPTKTASAEPVPAKPVAVAAAPATVQQVATAAPAPTEKAALAASNDQPAAPSIAKPDSTSGLPSFRWPAKGRVIAAYGAKTNGKDNDGINLSLPVGTPVKAADDGVVAYSGNELKGYGNLILVRHSNGYVTAYAHASELLVKRGDTIKRGQIIAKSGQTGEVESPQLHFEIRKGSTPVDPMQFLDGA